MTSGRGEKGPTSPLELQGTKGDKTTNCKGSTQLPNQANQEAVPGPPKARSGALSLWEFAHPSFHKCASSLTAVVLKEALITAGSGKQSGNPSTPRPAGLQAEKNASKLVIRYNLKKR